MANSFHVPCPSCEANVLVKGSGMIGKKIDCSKCKYRFTVPDPDDADEPDEKAEKKGKKKAAAKKKGGGNSKMLIGVGLGVAAVAALVVGIIAFTGGDSSSTTVNSTPAGPPMPTRATPGTPAGDGAADAGTGEGGPAPVKDGENPEGGPAPMGGGGEAPVKPKPKPAGSSGKDPTNLLPNKTAAVLRLNFEQLQKTPFHAALFDRQMLDFFKNNMLFEATDIQDAFVCLVDADRDPFVLIRTRAGQPLDEARMVEKMDLEPGPQSPIQGRPYRVIKNNPFVSAASRGLSTEALIGQAGMPVTEEDKKRWKDKPLAVSFYDSHTLIIAEVMILERYLTDLTKDGTPEYLTNLAPNDAPKPDAPKSDGGEGGEVGGPPPMPGRPGPGDATGGSGGGGPPPVKLFTSVPTYRTVPPELKELLNRLEADEKQPPAIVYADMLDQRVFERDLSVYAAVGGLIKQVAQNTKIFGMSIGAFGKEKMTGMMAFKYVSGEDARESVETGIMPLLNALKGPLSLILGTNVDIRGGGGAGGGPGGGGPGGFNGPPGGDAESAPGPGGGSRGGPPPGVGPSGFPGAPAQGGGDGLTLSHVDVGVSDTLATVDIELLWNQDRYTKLVDPAVRNLGEQLRGRMAVLSGEATHHTLSAAAIKLRDDKKLYIPGTKTRDAKSERYGLAFPPDHRASFLVDMLPFLGRGALRSQIQDQKFAWYAKENLPAAQKWVPEFLVPYYPQSAWRANHPLAEGNSLGGTNYVGMSGLGLDSARYDPNNPAHAKKVGMVGYDWGSKPADVTDGLSNTVYMIQVPPQFSRPWIAGGGSTVMGVDENLDKPQTDFVHRTPNGKRATFVLMGDGSVREVPENIDPKIFKAMVTRAGGESLDGLDKAAPKLESKLDRNTLQGGGAPDGIERKKPAPSDAKKEAAIKEELDKMQGVWKIKTAVGMKGPDGKPLPAEVLSKIETRVTGNRAVTIVAGVEAGVMELTIDPTASPKTMDSKMVRNPLNLKIGEVSLGTYELTDKVLKMKSGPEGSKERPKDVRQPPKDSKEMYVEMERVGD